MGKHGGSKGEQQMKYEVDPPLTIAPSMAQQEPAEQEWSRENVVTSWNIDNAYDKHKK